MHDPEQPCLAEMLLEVLLPALIRSGDIAQDTILGLADRMEQDAGREPLVRREEELHAMAAVLREWAAEAVTPMPVEKQADRRRSRFRIVD